MGVETGGNIGSSSAGASIGMMVPCLEWWGRRPGAVYMRTPPGSHLQSFPLTHCKPMPGPERGAARAARGPADKGGWAPPITAHTPLTPLLSRFLSGSEDMRTQQQRPVMTLHCAVHSLTCLCSGRTNTEHMRKCTFLTWRAREGFVLPVFRSPLARLLFSFWL